ncbi:hypothetical protein LSH36_613g01025 [Paralvinella palmiformis]|uniref:glycerophosphodiester phosphodiesterase n=1 Tax=Paralvinella palmiformis TaxID=53620 RepID=A0AAD9J5R8_9ANNE|nr:hypothetical protein LSH36_613g01025 [Paralvinella palmiformis]
MLVKVLSVVLIFLTCSVCLKTVSTNIVVETRSRPWIIAHRGSSGVYPEHTIAAYKRAIEDGADLIECDLLLTRDRQLVCLHEPYLTSSTNIAQHPEYETRKRKLTIPDHGELDDWFSFDFTLEELKSLRVKQRFSFRDQSFNGIYQIPTFHEYIRVAKEAKRLVGIYPEIKHPELINSLPFMNGFKFEDILLDVLKQHGYTKKGDFCLIQSFSDPALRYIKSKTDIRLVILVEREEDIMGPFLNDSKIEDWATLYHGIGAWKTQIVEYFENTNKYKNWISNETNLLDRVLDSGLNLHLYTFRNEDQFLAWNFKQDPIDEYLYFSRLGDIEGYFTDFPHTMFRAFEERHKSDGCNVAKTRTTNRTGSVTSSPVIRIIMVIITFCILS